MIKTRSALYRPLSEPPCWQPPVSEVAVTSIWKLRGLAALASTDVTRRPSPSRLAVPFTCCFSIWSFVLGRVAATASRFTEPCVIFARTVGGREADLLGQVFDDHHDPTRPSACRSFFFFCAGLPNQRLICRPSVLTQSLYKACTKLIQSCNKLSLYGAYTKLTQGLYEAYTKLIPSSKLVQSLYKVNTKLMQSLILLAFSKVMNSDLKTLLNIHSFCFWLPRASWDLLAYTIQSLYKAYTNLIQSFYEA
jgi:hypothetical protein